VPALARALQDEDGYVRQNAAGAIGAFGTLGAAAVPALIRALKDPLESVQVCAVESLGQIGAMAEVAVPHLQATRNNNQSVMSRPVRVAMERIRADAKASQP
jgi:HEAT repeat protein